MWLGLLFDLSVAIAATALFERLLGARRFALPITRGGAVVVTYLVLVLLLLPGSDVLLAVVEPVAGLPAAAAGVQPGDRVVAVEGAPVESFADLADHPRTAGQSVRLTLEREGRQREVTVTAGERGVLGLKPTGAVRRVTASQALAAPLQAMVAGLRLLTGTVAPVQQVGGPIVLQEAPVSRPPSYYLWLLAMSAATAWPSLIGFALLSLAVLRRPLFARARA